MTLTAKLFFNYLPHEVKKIWELWGVEFLVLMNFFFQSVLTFYGSSRKYEYKNKARVMVWLSYLLSVKFATIILGKLTTIPVDGDRRHTHSEFLALFGPFILMQIGGPDGITAFSIEDAELGLRQILNLFIQFFIVIYILVRSWTGSLISFLYLPMFLAGIIKYGETSWALKSALYCSSSTILRFHQSTGHSSLVNKVSQLDKKSAEKLIGLAYCRFFKLRPHLENWPPRDSHSNCSNDELSINELAEKEAFRVTEMELGFMYDVLYTKAWIVYTKTGCVLRFISFLSLIGTLYGFIAFFRDIFVYHFNVGFIYFVLTASVLLETYQILLLPFSDWAIVMIIKHLHGGVRDSVLKVIAPQSKKWRKWSGMVNQFNLIGFCSNDRPSIVRRWSIFQLYGMNVKIRKWWNTTWTAIDDDMKKEIVNGMKIIDEQRKGRPFVRVGEWTMARTDLVEDGDSIEKMFGDSFGSCIIQWHIATDNFCNRPGVDPGRPEIKTIKLISNYMMFFLARRPRVLGATNAVFLMNRALKIVPTRLRQRQETARLLVSEFGVSELINSLKNRGEDKRSKLFLSVWIEIICYAASNSERKYHAKQLWQGGQLITLVWLLLTHWDTDDHLFRPDPSTRRPCSRRLNNPSPA